MATKLAAEDGFLEVSTLVGTRTKIHKDIDLTFANKPSGEIFKKESAAAVKQAVKNLMLTNYLVVISEICYLILQMTMPKKI